MFADYRMNLKHKKIKCKYTDVKHIGSVLLAFKIILKYLYSAPRFHYYLILSYLNWLVFFNIRFKQTKRTTTNGHRSVRIIKRNGSLITF